MRETVVGKHGRTTSRGRVSLPRGVPRGQLIDFPKVSLLLLNAHRLRKNDRAFKNSPVEIFV